MAMSNQRPPHRFQSGRACGSKTMRRQSARQTCPNQFQSSTARVIAAWMALETVKWRRNGCCSVNLRRPSIELHMTMNGTMSTWSRLSLAIQPTPNASWKRRAATRRKTLTQLLRNISRRWRWRRQDLRRQIWRCRRWARGEFRCFACSASLYRRRLALWAQCGNFWFHFRSPSQVLFALVAMWNFLKSCYKRKNLNNFSNFFFYLFFVPFFYSLSFTVIFVVSVILLWLPRYSYSHDMPSVFSCCCLIFFNSLLLSTMRIDSWCALGFWLLSGCVLVLQSLVKCDIFCCLCLEYPRQMSHTTVLVEETVPVPNGTTIRYTTASIKLKNPPLGSSVINHVQQTRRWQLIDTSEDSDLSEELEEDTMEEWTE